MVYQNRVQVKSVMKRAEVVHTENAEKEENEINLVLNRLQAVMFSGVRLSL